MAVHRVIWKQAVAAEQGVENAVVESYVRLTAVLERERDRLFAVIAAVDNSVLVFGAAVATPAVCDGGIIPNVALCNRVKFFTAHLFDVWKCDEVKLTF